MTLKYKLHDFECKKCNKEWEDLSDDETSECKKCGATVQKMNICTGQMGRYSILDEEGKKDVLRRRSAEHSARELKKEPEKFGEFGVQRAREGQIRSVGGM